MSVQFTLAGNLKMMKVYVRTSDLGPRGLLPGVGKEVLRRKTLACLDSINQAAGFTPQNRTIERVRVPDWMILDSSRGAVRLQQIGIQRHTEIDLPHKEVSVYDLFQNAGVTLPEFIDSDLMETIIEQRKWLNHIYAVINQNFMFAEIYESEWPEASQHLKATAKGENTLADDKKFMLWRFHHMGTISRRVLEAFELLPRELFVPEPLRLGTYLDMSLPIGNGQTISQPKIVVEMTHDLRLAGDETVLEIGTGSGFQAAMLSRLCRWVHTIERLEVHSTHAREVLDRVGAINVTSHFGNGYYGLPEHAPYDRIIVTAGIDHLPEALWEQVKEGGWIVIPLNGSSTTIFKIDGNPVINYGEEVRFVPFVKD